MSENMKDKKPKKNDDLESMEFEIPDEDYLKDLDILNTLEKNADVEELMKMSDEDIIKMADIDLDLDQEDSEVKKILEDLDEESFMDEGQEEQAGNTLNLLGGETEDLSEEVTEALKKLKGIPTSEKGFVSVSPKESVKSVEEERPGSHLGAGDTDKESLRDKELGVELSQKGESVTVESTEERLSEIPVIDLDKTAMEESTEEFVTETVGEAEMAHETTPQTIETETQESTVEDKTQQVLETKAEDLMEVEKVGKSLDSMLVTSTPVEVEARTSDVDLRLSDLEMVRFKEQIKNAETLQGYIKKLNEYQTQIKEKIYSKLLMEYQTRRAQIFNAVEFIQMRENAKKDLQDLKSKKEEFEGNLEELKDDLEEIKVRHLVGEYDDLVLRDKEEEKKSQINSWSNRISKVDTTISFYQDLLSAEGLKGIPLLEEIIEWPEQQEIEEEIVAQEEETTIQKGVSAAVSAGLSFPEELPTDEMPEEIDLSSGSPAVAMISCDRCGKQTPANEKFCTKCGAKLKR